MDTADRFEILRTLGEGGMGEVLLAQDHRLGRQVALKRMLARPSGVDPRHLKRLEREARVQASTEHPHLLRLLDCLLEEDPPTLVLEFVQGKDLETILEQEGTLDEERVRRLCREVAGALDALHEAGAVHRDLKPANLMIRDENGDAVVMDLGLAWVDTETMLTATGSIVGTPRYLAPEQIAGEAHGPAADQYQLALIAVEALTGRPPFHRFEQPMPLLAAIGGGTSVAEWCEGLDRPPVDPQLAAVLDRALAVDPRKRYPSCAVFADAIDGMAVPDAPSFSPAGRALATGAFLPEAPSGLFGPGGRARALAPAAGLLALGTLAYFMTSSPDPEQVVLQVIGDAVVATWQGEVPGISLRVGGHEVRTPVPLEGGRWRLALRDLGEDEVTALLRWPGGESAPFPARRSSPALDDRIQLETRNRLRLEVRRPVRLRVQDAWVDLEAGPAVIAEPQVDQLEWTEDGLPFRRDLDLRDLYREEADRLLRDLEERDPLRTLADQLELREQRERRQQPPLPIEGFDAPRLRWAPMLERLPDLARADGDPRLALRLHQGWRAWREAMVREVILGRTPAPIGLPSGAAGAPRYRKEKPGTFPVGFRRLGLTGVDGRQTRTQRESGRFPMVTSEAKKIRIGKYDEAFRQVLFEWPAAPPGADLELAVVVSGLIPSAGLQLRADPGGGVPWGADLWHPRPARGDKGAVSGVFHVRVPGALAPPPRTRVSVEVASPGNFHLATVNLFAVGYRVRGPR